MSSNLKDHDDVVFTPFLGLDRRTVLVTDLDLVERAYASVADEMIRKAKRTLDMHGSDGRNNKYFDSYLGKVELAEEIRQGFLRTGKKFGGQYDEIFWDMIGEFNKMGVDINV